MNKDNIKFFKKEWKDANKLLDMNKQELLFQIWNERSSKLIYGLLGFNIGLFIGIIV